VLVHRSAKLILVQAFDQGAKALALSRVLIDVRAILRHASITIPLAGGAHQQAGLLLGLDGPKEHWGSSLAPLLT
jgi:hypothetical protein